MVAGMILAACGSIVVSEPQAPYWALSPIPLNVQPSQTNMVQAINDQRKAEAELRGGQ
jgi:hypothetical protein